MKRRARQFLEHVCIAGGLLLLSCSAPYRRYAVDGVKEDFCVPKEYASDIDAYFGLSGFSLGGCASLPESAKGSCVLPSQLVKARIVSLMWPHSQLWRDNKRPSSAAFDPNVEYTVDAPTGLLVVDVPRAKPFWLVWKRRHGDNGGPPTLHDLDELFVDCSKVEDSTDDIGPYRHAGRYACRRYVRGVDYALDLTFISKERVPGEEPLKRLEAATFAQVDRWRCKK